MENGRRGWQQIEDDRLLKIIRKFGTRNWSLIAQKLSMNTNFERTGKQCRERWYNHLNPQIDNKPWSDKDDEVLFEAHRRIGSKWKEISKLLSGRTDNSIKNHFYSTVRRCLRRISKLHGERNSTITMKSIKPNVLSKIVENTELTDLIVKFGRGRTKNENTSNLGIDEAIVLRIRNELNRISLQYDQKLANVPQLSKKIEEAQNGKQISEGVQASSLKDDGKENDRVGRPHQKLISYFEEETPRHRQEQEDIIAETHQDTKSKEENLPVSQTKLLYQVGSKEDLQKLIKEESNHERSEGNEWAINEEAQSNNFFVSPSCGRLFPDVRLIAKMSRASLSPTHSHNDDRIRSFGSLTNFYQNQNQKLQIHFDPNTYLIESNQSCSQSDKDGN